MKREFLKGFELSDEAIDQIMAENGRDVERFKAELTELEGLRAKLSDTEGELEGLRQMDVEGIRKAADDRMALAEQKEAEAQAKVDKILLDRAAALRLV